MADDRIVQSRSGQPMSMDTAKWQQTLNIWIDRFRKAQDVIRELEAEVEALHAENASLRAKLAANDV